MKVSDVVQHTIARRLAELFDSLLRQTIKPFEVIVLDDTSTNEIAFLCDINKSLFARRTCGLYVLTKLFGWIGKLLYCWQKHRHTIRMVFRRLVHTKRRE